MLSSTLDRLRCPSRRRKGAICRGSLQLFPEQRTKIEAPVPIFEVEAGNLVCLNCSEKFPILGGVAILVEDVRLYLTSHVKGIAKMIKDSDIPREYRRDFLAAKAEIQSEHIEEDLEAERVNSLYLMNHYLHVSDHQKKSKAPWWIPRSEPGSPLMDSLVKEYWDQGPFSKIKDWIEKISASSSRYDVIDLGCGVGGLGLLLKPYIRSYLGIDSSFASVTLARHLVLGSPYPGKIRIPEDLLDGPVSREVPFLAKLQPKVQVEGVDYVVGDLENPPVPNGKWDIALALNAIDMLDDPSVLPRLKHRLLRKKGIAIQCCPYIWYEGVARDLKAQLPAHIKSSAKATEWLYEQEGFKIDESIDHVPWLFFKHVRQMEIYSVHLFRASQG